MGLEHLWILVSEAGPGTNSLQIPRDNCNAAVNIGVHIPFQISVFAFL